MSVRAFGCEAVASVDVWRESCVGCDFLDHCQMSICLLQ